VYVPASPDAFTGISLQREGASLSDHGQEKEATMVHLQLEPTEAEVLRMVLESYLSDLRMEIADTDSMDFREKLKARKMVLRKVVSMIEEARKGVSA
jgi:hypothetical protein